MSDRKEDLALYRNLRKKAAAEYSRKMEVIRKAVYFGRESLSESEKAEYDKWSGGRVER